MLTLNVEVSPNDTIAESFRLMCKAATKFEINVSARIEGLHVVVYPGDDPDHEYAEFMANKPLRRRNIEAS